VQKPPMQVAPFDVQSVHAAPFAPHIVFVDAPV
jgi:hypothetical protein